MTTPSPPAPMSPRTTPESSQPIRRSRVRESCLQGIDGIAEVCLTLSIVGVPLMMAGVREAGVALFVGCSLLMGLSWAVSEVLRPSSSTRVCGAELIAVLACGLIGLQLLPLPQSLLGVLSPFNGTFLTLWGTADGQMLGSDPWRTISLTPERTRSGFTLLLAYAVFFLTLVHRLRSRRELDRMIRLIAISATLMAAVGLGQLFFGNGRYLWLIEHPYRDASGAAKGTFTNPNHFAGFLSLGLGPLVWCWLCRSHPVRVATKDRPADTTRRSPRRRTEHCASVHPATSRLDIGAGAALAAVFLAGLLSLSRGGIAALLVAVLMIAAGWRAELRRLSRIVLPALGFAVAGVVAAGAGPLASEWNGLTSANSLSDLSRGRIQLWAALLDASAYFWPAGSGLGSHADVYPTWLPLQSDFRFSHAENGYLQVFLETGLPGVALLLGGIVLTLRWCWGAWNNGHRDDRQRSAAFAAGLLASVVHSGVDFVWYIPGCMIVTLALAAGACRCYQLGQDQLTPAPPARGQTGYRLAWCLLLLIVPVARHSADGVWQNVSTLAAQNSYRHHSVRSSKATRQLSMTAVDERLDQMIHDLESCRAANPNEGDAATRLATLYLRRFESSVQQSENSMTLREIRDTVQHSNFASSSAARDWLRRAFGECADDLQSAWDMAIQGLQRHPLRGESYIVLAELEFVFDGTAAQREALVAQATRLRPHAPPVLYSAGALAAEAGDLRSAFGMWRRAYSLDVDIRAELIERLAPALPASELMTLFPPDALGYWLMFDAYRRLEQTTDSQTIAHAYVRQLATLARLVAPGNADFWVHSHQMLVAADRPGAALNCLKEAVRQSPDNLAARRLLAFALLDAADFDSALRQLNWCQLRQPQDKRIDEALRTVKTRVEESRQTAYAVRHTR